jgi:hypothetical protein
LSASRFDFFTPEERGPGTHWVGRRVAVKKMKNFGPGENRSRFSSRLVSGPLNCPSSDVLTKLDEFIVGGSFSILTIAFTCGLYHYIADEYFDKSCISLQFKIICFVNVEDFVIVIPFYNQISSEERVFSSPISVPPFRIQLSLVH